MDAVPSACYIVDGEFNLISVNESAKAIYPHLEVGQKCHKCLMDLDSPCSLCPITNRQVGPRVYRDPIRGIAESVDCLELDYPGHGACHQLIISTVGEQADFSATLPTSQEGLQKLALVKALTVDYYDVFSVELSTDRMTMYRHNGQLLDESSAFRNTLYSDGMESYINRYVVEEDRGWMREQNALPALREQLKTSEAVVYHYRVIWKGEVHHFLRKIVRIGSPEDFRHIVIGIACEDEEVRAHERHERMARSLTEMERDSLTGLYTR